MLKDLRWVAPIMILAGLGGPVSADVITDWNEKAVAFATKHRMLPPQAERVIASVHVAMFDAVNSIERRYRPYRLAVTNAKDTSKWPNVKPFAMTSPSQFRPQPPIPLKGEEWTADYNEIKSLGGKTSTKR